MFRWTEVRKWAKENGFYVYKTRYVDEYFWDGSKIKGPIRKYTPFTGLPRDFKGKKYTELKDLVLDLWNKKTNNAHLAYQKAYKKIDKEFSSEMELQHQIRVNW